MKEYQTPETEIILFPDTDVLTNSDPYANKFSYPDDPNESPII